VNIIQCEQGTDEWFKVHLGVPSASCFDKIITVDGKSSKQRQKYLYKLAGEKVSGIPEESFQSEVMKRGVLMEDDARRLYQLVNDVAVEQVGFCIADGYGCSPDGLIGQDGGLEIKCPGIATHVSYLVDGCLPEEYFQQVQGSLLVTGRAWWDFMSFYPGLKPFIIRVEPDKKFRSALKEALGAFCKELEETITKIR
jgi:hypothetical protein